MKNRYFTILGLIFLTIPVITGFGEADDIKSQKQERTETIKYGIDSQVIDLIDTLETEKNYDYNSVLLDLLKDSNNSQLKVKIIKLFKLSDDDSGVDNIFNELQENYNLPDNVTVSYINYISKYQNKEISDYFLDLVENESNTISIAAITALSDSSLTNLTDRLIEYLDDSLFEDLRKPAIIETLGKLKAVEALGTLTDIATDIYTDNKSLRWKAVVALGEIGAEESLDILKSLFSDKDPYLRNYTISALKNYPPAKVSSLLIQGLKDSSWRVRVNAAESIGELKLKEAVPILIYKGENDPDIRNVRAAAVKALGDIGTAEAYNFMRELYVNKRADIQLRSIAIEILAEKDLSKSIKAIESVFDEEWDNDKSTILDYTCNVLSMTKGKELKNLYARMLSYDKTLNLKLYALRGIRLNSFISFKSDIEELTGDETPGVIRKLAIDVAEDL